MFRLVEFRILIVSRVKLIPLQNNERRFMIHDLEFTPQTPYNREFYLVYILNVYICATDHRLDTGTRPSKKLYY